MDDKLSSTILQYLALSSIGGNNIVAVASKAVIAKGDSGATQHYWRDQDKCCLDNISSFDGPEVTLPNNEVIKSTERGSLPLSTKLGIKAQQASILPCLKSSSLISLGQLCDDDCKILLDKKSLFVVKDKELIMEGYRNIHDSL